MPLAHETTYGVVPSIVYDRQADGGHGNFLPSSYRRILANPAWAARLAKSYTGGARLPRSGDRWRGELECATSSDALLMNVFCHPGVLHRAGVCSLLGVRAGATPQFGTRAQLPMKRDEVDRTEFDMTVDGVLVEAKLTESGFGRASRERLMRYVGLEDTFELDQLPWTGNTIRGYQIVRGLLAAVGSEQRYLVLLDARRTDLAEVCFGVVRAVRNAEARSRFRLVTWQDLSGVLSRGMQQFLAEKYGIVP